VSRSSVQVRKICAVLPPLHLLSLYLIHFPSFYLATRLPLTEGLASITREVSGQLIFVLNPILSHPHPSCFLVLVTYLLRPTLHVKARVFLALRLCSSGQLLCVILIPELYTAARGQYTDRGL
jgi:hypothetical protein